MSATGQGQPGSAFADVDAANAAFAASRTGTAPLPAGASRGLAVLTCIDSRIDPAAALGLGPGEAKVVRNAGGRASDDAIRSLALAVATLGVRRILVMHHTRCALAAADDEQLREAMRRAGADVPAGYQVLAMGANPSALREDVEAVRASALIAPGVIVAGWRYDVDSGRALVEVD